MNHTWLHAWIWEKDCHFFSICASHHMLSQYCTWECKFCTLLFAPMSMRSSAHIFKFFHLRLGHSSYRLFLKRHILQRKVVCTLFSSSVDFCHCLVSDVAILQTQTSLSSQSHQHFLPCSSSSLSGFSPLMSASNSSNTLSHQVHVIWCAHCMMCNHVHTFQRCQMNALVVWKTQATHKTTSFHQRVVDSRHSHGSCWPHYWSGFLGHPALQISLPKHTILRDCSTMYKYSSASWFQD